MPDSLVATLKVIANVKSGEQGREAGRRQKAVEDAIDESTHRIATALKRHQFNQDRGSF